MTDCPRPENYLVDIENGLNGTGDTRFIWSSIASACESGLDFSSRWFAYSGEHASLVLNFFFTGTEMQLHFASAVDPMLALMLALTVQKNCFRDKVFDPDK